MEHKEGVCRTVISSLFKLGAERLYVPNTRKLNVPYQLKQKQDQVKAPSDELERIRTFHIGVYTTRTFYSLFFFTLISTINTNIKQVLRNRNNIKRKEKNSFRRKLPSTEKQIYLTLSGSTTRKFQNHRLCQT